MADSEEYDQIHKILLIGDSGVGKSSLVRQFVHEGFDPVYVSTIGVDFRIRTLVMDGLKVKMQIWDTAGQCRFRSITQSYYRGASGILLVFDLTNYESFLSLPSWLADVSRYASETVRILLVGNKNDTPPCHRAVVSVDAQAFATEHGLQYVETSAKNIKDVEAAFLSMSSHICKGQRASPSAAELLAHPASSPPACVGVPLPDNCEPSFLSCCA